MKKLFAITFILLLFLTLASPALAIPAPIANVGTFAQLKTALEDATTTNILFTGDIQLTNKAVTINPAKSELVIDGAGHTLTGYNSASLTYTLRMNKKGNLKNITFQNMNIAGSNYYGIMTVADSTTLSGVTVTFDSITFTGPALTWARRSNIVIRDSDIRIVSGKLCAAHEVAEALRVRLEGNVNIVKDAPNSSNDLFWISGSNGGVTVAAGANINIQSNQNGNKVKGSGFVKFSCASLHIRFEDDCTFNYVGNNLFQQGDSVDELYVGKRSDINITTYGNLYCSYGIFNVRGAMTVDEDANLQINVLNNKEPQPAVQLRRVGNLTFNRPKEVFIYNSSTKSGNTGLAMGPWGCDVSINFNAVKSIEYWKLNTAPAGSLPAPTYLWTNSDGAIFNASERISGSKVKSASATGYYGLTPFNTSTAAVKNINVIRVNGAYKPDEPVKTTIDIEGIVLWEDFNNMYNTRPFSVNIGLFRNGEPQQMVAVAANGDGNFMFEGLDITDTYGTPYTYTINQASTGLNGYTTVISGSAADSFSVTNTLINLFDIEVTVIWNDSNNALNRRPATIDVGLFRNNAPFKVQKVPAIIDGNQQIVTFKDLEKYDATGIEYLYTAVQQPVNYYTTTITGYTIINEITR